MASLSPNAGPRYYNNSQYHRPYQHNPDVRPGTKLRVNDNGRSYFCLICDQSFGNERALDEHLTEHDPTHQPTVKKTTIRSCRVCQKEFRLQPARLVEHRILAEKHRNIRSQDELHSTTNRPELWCAICETRFTHTDRKQKHMEEMNFHNMRFRELQSQARLDPNFDWSILEIPELSSPSPSPSQAQPSGPSNSASTRQSQSTQGAPSQTSHLSAHVISGDGVPSNTETESLHYCRPCDRYFSSANELDQHQLDEGCVSPETSRQPNNSESVPVPTLPSASSIVTQSMTSHLDITDAAPSLPPPPFPRPPYEESIPTLSSEIATGASISQLSIPVTTSGRSPNPENTASSVAPTGRPQATFECPLCLEREDNLSSLACGHIFGTECIQETLREDPRCPICRESVDVFKKHFVKTHDVLFVVNRLRLTIFGEYLLLDHNLLLFPRLGSLIGGITAILFSRR